MRNAGAGATAAAPVLPLRPRCRGATALGTPRRHRCLWEGGSGHCGVAGRLPGASRGACGERPDRDRSRTAPGRAAARDGAASAGDPIRALRAAHRAAHGAIRADGTKLHEWMPGPALHGALSGALMNNSTNDSELKNDEVAKAAASTISDDMLIIVPVRNLVLFP